MPLDSFFFVFNLGGSGLWFGLLVGLTLAGLLLTLRFYRLTRVN